MSKFFIYLFSACSVFTSLSCKNNNKKSAHYFPVDSLVRAQIKTLAESKAVISKRGEIDGEEETNSFTPPDTVAWNNELDIFLELEVINNPVHAGNYLVENGIRDSTSNLTIRSFTSKDKEKEELPVVYLKVFYLDTPSKIRRMEALYREENSLVKGSRLLIMEFQDIYNKTVLTSYSIEGSQQMFLGESVKFSMKGTISIP